MRTNGGRLHRSGRSLPCGAPLLLLALAASAEAQYPASSRSTRSTTSVITQLPVIDTAAGPGAMRQLVCRGGGSLQIKPQDPSPRDARYVGVSITYARNSVAVGEAYQTLQPGACTWNPYGLANVPQEPGVVQIDLDRVGSELVPNAATFATYLRDPRHYWSFFVDDRTNFSNSNGSYGGQFRAAADSAKPTVAKPEDARRERLRCRGGSGLAFSRHGSPGQNLVLMKLAYSAAATAAGPIGGGLTPGTCAWAQRESGTQEPGKVAFVTPKNAQLDQVKRGEPVDRSTIAAERWPDAQSIPVYMADPAHYWTFTVKLADPDTAIRHAAWKPTVPEAPEPESTPPPTPPVSSTPSTYGAGGTYRPGAATTTAVSGVASTDNSTSAAGERTPGSAGTSVAFDFERIRSLTVTPEVNSVAMRFQAGEQAPLVQISLTPPVREPSSGRWFFPGEKQALSVVGSGSGVSRDYSAANTAPLMLDTEYHYVIGAPEPARSLGRRQLPDAEHQAVGTFRTLHTTVRVRFERIYIIDDSDGGGNGELAFALELNDKTASEIGTGLAEHSPGTLMDWGSGSTHDLGYEYEADGQGRLRIQVSGFDNDAAVGNGTLRKGWLATAGGDGSGDWNQARGEYQLDKYPERAFDFPFKIRTGPGSELQFEAEGRVFVTRQ
jgi:hypothetical protein